MAAYSTTGAWNRSASESNWQYSSLSVPITADDVFTPAIVLDGTATLQPGAFQAFLDGNLIGSADGSQLWSHSGGISIGNVNGRTRFHDGTSDGLSLGFAGEIEQLHLYKRALSSTELQALSQ